MDRYQGQAGWARREGRFSDHLDRTGETQAGRTGNFGLVLFRFFVFSDFSVIFPFFSYLFSPNIITDNITTITFYGPLSGSKRGAN